MAHEGTSRRGRFPFGYLGLLGAALAGGPLAALILLGIEKIAELTEAAGYEDWVAMLITYPLLVIGSLIAFATLLLILATPFLTVYFLGALMSWSVSPPAKVKSEVLTETTP